MEVLFSSLLSITITVVAGFLLYMLQQANKRNEELKSDKEKAIHQKEEADRNWRNSVTQALIQVLRIQLCEYHEKYMEVGSIPTYAYDNWCRMYALYKNLGGNGMVTHMNDDIESINMKNK